MNRVLLSFLLMFAASLSIAEDLPDWYESALKSPTPNQLGYLLFVDEEDCPVEFEEVRNIVDGVFVRSRIKPLLDDVSIYKGGSAYLNLAISCLSSDTKVHTFSVRVDFGQINPKPMVLFDWPYGTYGRGDHDFILQAFKGRVESAITDHIKANFDL